LTRRLPIAVAGLIAAAALAAPASAGLPIHVTVDDNFFNPATATMSAVADLEWQSSGGSTSNEHSVTQDKGLFDNGVETDNINFQIRPSAGTFPYYCTVHGGKGGVGMSGVLKVRPSLAAMKRRGGFAFEVVWADGDGDSGDQFDVRYKVSGKPGFKTWLKDTGQASAVFGEGNDPVNVKPGKTYSIQVRSQLSSNPKKHSDWSPSLKLSVV
jgi:plastocyanin